MKVFKNIAKLIKEKRLKSSKENGESFSQAELAVMIGYKNGQFVSNAERALCSIPPRKGKLLQKILKISTQELIDAYLKDYEEYLRGELK